jgi:hypothetical protein
LNRQELEQRLENVVNNIRTSETELKRLREEKKQRILLLHPNELKTISSRIRELEDQVADNKLAQEALKKEIQEFKEKEPEAAKILKRLTEFWPTAVAEYERLMQIHSELRAALQKITVLNDKMMALRNQHRNLIGDSIYTPQIPIPREIYLAAEAKLGALPKALDLRLASEREQERIADQLKQQRPIVSRILERAGEKWPVCPLCEDPMLASPRGPDPAYKLSEDGSSGYVLFRCPKHPEQTRDIVFPARQVRPMDRILPFQGPVSPRTVSVFEESLHSRNQSHGSATPGLTTTQQKGGEE